MSPESITPPSVEQEAPINPRVVPQLESPVMIAPPAELMPVAPTPLAEEAQAAINVIAPPPAGTPVPEPQPNVIKFGESVPVNYDEATKAQKLAEMEANQRLMQAAAEHLQPAPPEDQPAA